MEGRRGRGAGDDRGTTSERKPSKSKRQRRLASWRVRDEEKEEEKEERGRRGGKGEEAGRAKGGFSKRGPTTDASGTTTSGSGGKMR